MTEDGLYSGSVRRKTSRGVDEELGVDIVKTYARKVSRAVKKVTSD